MTQHLTRDLGKIKGHVLRMAGLAEETLGLAMEAYSQLSQVPTLQLAQAESKIDSLQLEIDDELVKCLALHHPVAGDLRFVTAAMRIVNDLERIGDHASNIADRLFFLSDHELPDDPIEIESMMSCASSMLRDGLNAFVTGDSSLARDVLLRDDIVDDLNRRHFELLIARMKSDSDSVEVAVALLSISRAVERIADLATNIAEDVVFMVEAKDIRHPDQSVSNRG